MVLGFAVLEVAVLSIERAKWIEPQPSLTIVLLLAVIIGSVLARSRWPALVSFIIALIVGAIISLWQAASLMLVSGILPKLNQVFIELSSWWQAIASNSTVEVTVHFALMLVISVWIIGFLSAWFLTRRGNYWVISSLGGVLILINLSNLSEHNYVFFFFYLLSVMLLIGYQNLERIQKWFLLSRRGIIYTLVASVCLAAIAGSIVWQLPVLHSSALEPWVVDRMPGINDIEDYFTRQFSSVPRKQTVLLNEQQEFLLIGSPVSQSEQVQFVVKTQQPFYWWTHTYDFYTGQGWRSSATTDQLPRETAVSSEYYKRTQVNYTVETQISTDLLLVAGEFVATDQQVSVQSLAPQSYDISLVGSTDDVFLPPDIQLLSSSLREAQEGNQLDLDEFNELLPDDLIMTRMGWMYDLPTQDNYDMLVDEFGRLPNIKVERTPVIRGNTAVVVATNRLDPRDRYTVTSNISLATAEELLEVRADYPSWITDHYLQVPPTLPQRVQELSESVIRDADSIHKKVMAVKQYLYKFPYRLETELLPLHVDGVDYFLFEGESGNCIHFASAMVMMLRCVGVPARLSLGFRSTEWDPEKGECIVRDKNYHAWPEVYFPGYGWVYFEATPALIGEFAELWQEEGTSSDIVLGEGVNEILPGALDQQQNYLITILISVASTLVLMVLMFLFWLEYPTGKDYILRIYAKLCFLASVLRMKPLPQQTPLEYRTVLVNKFPNQSVAIDDIIRGFLVERYSAQKGIDLGRKEELRKSWRRVYTVLLGRILSFGR